MRTHNPRGESPAIPSYSIKPLLPLLTVAALIVQSGPANAAEDKPAPPQLLARADNRSFKYEIEHTLERGLAWLLANQNSNGWWSTPDHPSVTALALTAMMGEPKGRWKNSAEAKKGYDFVLRCVKPDGGIYVTELANYNTSICMMSLLAAQDSKHDTVLRRARSFVAGMQADLGAAGEMDTPWDGGIGYSHAAGRSDMNNTLTALEALYYSKHLVADKGGIEKDLNWAAAIQFLQNCQNLPGVNKQGWVSTDARDRGGFVYDPETTKAASVTNANGQIALRSYGSISYAGLLSYIYADLKKSDPRVQATLEWLRTNFSLTENPGMGQQGYYYYLHLMTKALNAAEVEVLQTKDGKPLDWRHDVAMRLIDAQKANGSWQNETGRWWEKDPSLVTAYAVMTLEMLVRKL